MDGAREDLLADVGADGVTVTHAYDALPAVALEVDAAALARLARSPHVRSISPDIVLTGALAQSVPMINADDVHDTLGYTGAGVTVAVLDTGVDTDHPDFIGDIAYQECWLLDNSCPGGGTHTSGPGSAEADHFHGANVAGIITSGGNVAPIGVAPDANIAAYKVLNLNNQGFFSDWLAALNDIIANHPEVDVVNMSLVDSTNHGSSCDALPPVGHHRHQHPAHRRRADVRLLRQQQLHHRHHLPRLRLQRHLRRRRLRLHERLLRTLRQLHRHPELRRRRLLLEQRRHASTCWRPAPSRPRRGLRAAHRSLAGTSMAAPHAAGLAALMLEAAPSLTPTQIETAMESTGIPRLDPKSGVTTPRIDAYAAVVGVTDADSDGVPAVLDNCPADANPLQENNDRNFIDNPAPLTQDDTSRVVSDLSGDPCDIDDDNDGLPDATEATFPGMPGCASTTAALDSPEPGLRRRRLPRQRRMCARHRSRLRRLQAHAGRLRRLPRRLPAHRHRRRPPR